MLSIIKRLKEKFIQTKFQSKISRVRKTKPISNFDENSELYLLSMVRSKDINMLLIALKSFARFVPIKGVIIVKDPDITRADELVLKQHLVNVDLVNADDMVNKDIPRGGTWERIYAIAHHSANKYIIQIDADTITNHSPLQVMDLVEKRKAFTIGTNQGRAFKSLKECSDFAKSKKERNVHIQLLCESLLTTLPEYYNSYVRGCSGFTGFPQGKLTVEQLIEVSKHYYEQVGSRWEEWGTEQFTSNLMISNMESKVVLDVNNYDVPHENYLEQTFIHYIGPTRYTSFKYLKNANKVISEL